MFPLSIFARVAVSSAAGLIDEEKYLNILGRDIDLYDRMWDEYALWYLIVVGAICLAFCITSLMLFLKRRKAIKAAPAEPWDMKTAYRKWAIGGLIGDHRYYLDAWSGIFYPLLVSAFIVVVGIDVMPNFYGIIPADQIYISILAWSVLRVIIGFWLFDAFWIRYRCYCQPFLILRKQERALIKQNQAEGLISKKDEKRHAQLVNRIIATLQNLKRQMQSEYDGTRNGILRSVGNFFRSKDPWVEFEEKKLAEINRLYSKGITTYEEYFDFLASLKEKNFNKLSRYLYRDAAVAEALSEVIRQALEVPSENQDGVTIPVFTPDHSQSNLFDAALLKRERQIELLPLSPVAGCGPKEMERIAKWEGQKAIEKVSALADIINTPLKETIADMEHSLTLHNEFWTAYYIPLRNMLFRCRPSFWDFITHKPVEVGPFMEICTSQTKSVGLPAAQNRITPKARDLAEDMRIFMQVYTDEIHSLI